jgi:tetratricopeptide (TPR) repeat protein
MGEAPLDLINNPFIKYTGEIWVYCTTPEKLAMVFWSLGKYLQLLIFPLALTTDYYPRFIEVLNFANPVALASLIAYLALGLFVIYQLWKKQKHLYLFGIAFYLITLSVVSNLIFPVGTNLAERFLFTPSLGYCILLGALLYPYLDDIKSNKAKLVLSGIGIIVLLFGVRTFVRNFDFKSNKVLFAKDIQVSHRSAKMQSVYGAMLAEEALHTQSAVEKSKLVVEAMGHLNEALRIHPTYLETFYMRGNVFFMLGNYNEAIQDYRRCLNLNENFKEAHGNYALALRESARQILQQGGDVQLAIRQLEESLKLFPEEQETAILLEAAKKSQTINQ